MPALKALQVAICGGAASPADRSFLGQYDGDNPSHLAGLASLVSQAWDRLDWSPQSVNSALIQSLAGETQDKAIADDVRTAFNYLAIWAEISNVFQADAVLTRASVLSC